MDSMLLQYGARYRSKDPNQEAIRVFTFFHKLCTVVLYQLCSAHSTVGAAGNSVDFLDLAGPIAAVKPCV